MQNIFDQPTWMMDINACKTISQSLSFIIISLCVIIPKIKYYIIFDTTITKITITIAIYLSDVSIDLRMHHSSNELSFVNGFSINCTVSITHIYKPFVNRMIVIINSIRMHTITGCWVSLEQTC